MLGCADFDDVGTEFFDFFVTEAGDGLELRESLRAGEDDASESVGGEDEEEREIEFFGLGFAPFAEALVQGLLIGGEVVGGFGIKSRADEGLRRMSACPGG